jgi:hypothetical protein
MAYQRDPRRPDQPFPGGDPLDPPIIRDEPLMDRPIENMNAPGDRSSMLGILGVVAVIVLLLIAATLYRAPSTTDGARTVSQDRTATSPMMPGTK